MVLLSASAGSCKYCLVGKSLKCSESCSDFDRIGGRDVDSTEPVTAEATEGSVAWVTDTAWVLPDETGTSADRRLGDVLLLSTSDVGFEGVVVTGAGTGGTAIGGGGSR